MLSRKTVLVLGAGASKEYGLPTGIELAAQISGLFDVDGDVNSLGIRDDVFRRFVSYSNFRHLGSAKDIRHATRRIAEGLPKSGSIDEFLYINSRNQLAVRVGKAAIAYVLLSIEKSAGVLLSSDAPNVKTNFVRPSTYIHELWGLLRRGHTTEYFSGAFDNISVVSFNYDRVFVCAMQELLSATFDAQHEAVRDIVRKVSVIHPYGSLGEWSPGMQAWRSEEDLFGQIDRATSSLLTYFESDALNKKSECWSCIRESDCVIFLGFGFHAQNIEFIPTDENSQGKFVYGTVSGLKNSRINEISSMLGAKFRINGGTPYLLPNSCHGLIYEISDWL